jgi:hypothetical protein
MAIAVAETDIFLEKSQPKGTGDKDYNPSGKTWTKKKIGSYKVEQISTSPFEVKVSGNYDTSLAPYGGGGDAQHSFESRKKDKFGGTMNTILNALLKKIYTDIKINPKITLINVTVGVIMKWEVTVKQSDDGKAYIGLSSRGGYGGALTRKDIDDQVGKKKASLPGELGETKVDFDTVIDYKNASADIRQVFFQYNSPTKYPPYPAGSQPQNDQSQSNDQNAKNLADAQASANKSAKEGRLVNSKITLQKVSGPGEIVGVTELDLQQGSVTFTGIQFTEPGEYVVSVKGSSTQIESTQFSITVQPSEEIVEQESSGQDEPIAGTRPIIAQIDEPTVNVPAMTHNATTEQPDNDITTNLGFLPFVYYGAAQIRPMDIQKLNIFYDEFVPKCLITFTDTLGLVNSPETSPTANSTIEIFLDSGSEQLKSIHLKFLIDQKKDNRNGSITIFGKLNLKEFYKIAYSSYSGTSFEVLRTISKELGLGYNSNIVQTNDAMKWIRNGINLENFIRGIITKSYISDDSFMVGYIDYYYCFNYVDVEKEYNRDNKSDIGISSTGVSSLGDGTDESKSTKLFLTNDKSANSSPFYFSKYTFINNATNQITNEGVTTDSKVYDRTNKRFLNFKVDALTSQDDTLKTLRSEDDINTNFRTEFTGKLDTDNVHENYLYAVTQNKRNLTNLANIMADITLPIPNFNIYKFQKIRVVFTNEKQTLTEPDLIMTRYTGDWIIIDISYTYQKSALVQTVRIARKELTKTQKEIDTETTKQDNSQNSEINDNPVLEQTPVIPNSIYEVGQEVYIEQNGKMYIVIVDKLSDSGLEISGKIKKSPIGLPFGYTNVTPGLSASGLTPSSATTTSQPQGESNIKAVQLSSVGIYTGVGDQVITATVPFLINDIKEITGIGTASLPPEGVGKQKEMAVKSAEIDAINKFKAQQ